MAMGRLLALPSCRARGANKLGISKANEFKINLEYTEIQV
jgi:hypothetical protein